MNFGKGQARQIFKHFRVRSHDRGFTLIEVLVTLVVISIGLLSIAQLQARALQQSYSTLQRTVAVVQANDLLERMWSGYCSAAFPDQIEADWNNAHPPNDLLPGRTAVLTESNGEYTLVISWDDQRARDEIRPNFTYVFRMLDPDVEEC